MTELHEPSFANRLHVKQYSRRACVAALHGEEIPQALAPPLHQFCTVRGIRYNSGFGEELRGVLPLFTRALNARSIMSDVVPNFNSAEEIPYCIWHPATGKEDTYRELVRRYPDMRYQAARACAVAGYTVLYHELNVLPDVHIAEEARECGNLEIYETIVSQPVRYSIMNDYTLSVELDSKQPTYLNGDTAVRWTLDIKQEFQDATSEFTVSDNGQVVPDDWPWETLGYTETTFNICEDMQVDEHESSEATRRTLASRSELRFLYEPLPADLPTVQKDLLILMAAYHGNVDRYVRLRRPSFLPRELACCVRGIYHSTFFAVWWSKQPGERDSDIEKAINARFIMNNMLSRAPLEMRHTPYLIWWPTVAHRATYRHLAKVQPSMLPQIVRACIYAGYVDLFDELLPEVQPDQILLREAERQRDHHFQDTLIERAKSLDIAIGEPPSHEYWKLEMTSFFNESVNNVPKYLDSRHISTSFAGQYDGLQCSGATVLLNSCLPDAWKPAEDDEQVMHWLDYKDWPPLSQTVNDSI